MSIKPSLVVVKIGGNVIDDQTALSLVLSHFSKIVGAKILIHGGGKIATQVAADLGKPQQMIEGRRVTDAETLKIITMVYGGLVNKTIVSQLQALGVSALGVTGADADVIRSKKRGLSPNGIDYGFVGDVIHVRAAVLAHWLKEGTTPVIAPLTHDGHGQILNTNADSMANAVAVAMAATHSVRLIYSFEKSGVLTDVNDDQSFIPRITPAVYTGMKKDGKVFDGMIPKLDNAFEAIRSGVSQVILGKAVDLPSLLTGTAGTRLSNE